MRVVGVGWGDAPWPAKVRRPSWCTRRIDVPGSPAQLATVRRWVHGFLKLDKVAAETAEVVVLLASELVANAVAHSCSRDGEVTVLLNLDFTRGRVRLDVIDDGPAVPVEVGSRGVEHEHGRGLLLVEELSDRWGCYADEHGTGVWFELAMHDQGRCPVAVHDECG
ncbi:Anti-sigma regulatory factor (Ser/Thr protein kinase) [Sinosporangium album]|uniref:Anti-sigma regulatory factor (Ser/Thr protein kinase) n=1 Tax=Sinosporangium album TaxID=504805 RepID=A0A1G8FNI6_9ACTN|nr:ATP-binding protein [Sinosporangium album]SDH83649.1 Anti-sigma regulatory factor (Ser/Thr protein kinase) [Sinosporangium album]